MRLNKGTKLTEEDKEVIKKFIADIKAIAKGDKKLAKKYKSNVPF